MSGNKRDNAPVSDDEGMIYDVIHEEAVVAGEKGGDSQEEEHASAGVPGGGEGAGEASSVAGADEAPQGGSSRTSDGETEAPTEVTQPGITGAVIEEEPTNKPTIAEQLRRMGFEVPEAEPEGTSNQLYNELLAKARETGEPVDVPGTVGVSLMPDGTFDTPVTREKHRQAVAAARAHVARTGTTNPELTAVRERLRLAMDRQEAKVAVGARGFKLLQDAGLIIQDFGQMGPKKGPGGQPPRAPWYYPNIRATDRVRVVVGEKR